MAENVQFTFCAPKENRRNSAPIIIKSPVADFSKREKHLNFVSLSSKFPESPDEADAKKPKRGLRSPVKSPAYRGPKSPKSPSASNYFKFPPPAKKIAEKIDEYEVYEGSRTAFAPVSPTNVNYVPVSPQGPRSSRTSSRQSSSSASGPRGSVSSTASTAQSEMSSLISSSVDSIGSSSTRCRRSTSDLTDLTEECSTENTSLSRPCSPRSRRGSMKGNCRICNVHVVQPSGSHNPRLPGCLGCSSEPPLRIKRALPGSSVTRVIPKSRCTSSCALYSLFTDNLMLNQYHRVLCTMCTSSRAITEIVNIKASTEHAILNVSIHFSSLIVFFFK